MGVRGAPVGHRGGAVSRGLRRQARDAEPSPPHASVGHERGQSSHGVALLCIVAAAASGRHEYRARASLLRKGCLQLDDCYVERGVRRVAAVPGDGEARDAARGGGGRRGRARGQQRRRQRPQLARRPAGAPGAARRRHAGAHGHERGSALPPVRVLQHHLCHHPVVQLGIYDYDELILNL